VSHRTVEPLPDLAPQAHRDPLQVFALRVVVVGLADDDALEARKGDGVRERPEVEAVVEWDEAVLL
jgi:hypothetical protein